MASRLVGLGFAANDPLRLAGFWAGVLGRETADDGVTLLPSTDREFRIRFLPTSEPKTGPNQMHFDLTSSSLEEQEATVARVLELGGRHLDVGQLPEEEHVVLADLKGNEFCVIEPGNNFLADCGFIGALSSDGLQEVGYFWSRALDWPLVWDQDHETAIQSPEGGSKISWGGPPLAVRTGRSRLHLELAPVDRDQRAEIDRLVALGATRVGVETGEGGGRMEMLDPGGNEFRVLSR